MFAMIIFGPSKHPWTVIYLRGAQETDELLRLPQMLAKCQQHASTRLLFFDWSGLTSWKLGGLHSVQNRMSLQPGIVVDRVALLHHRRWNRQAAWLAALFRTGGTMVRSFNTVKRPDAVAWLLGKDLPLN
jgi:hypothetical protein